MPAQPIHSDNHIILKMIKSLYNFKFLLKLFTKIKYENNFNQMPLSDGIAYHNGFIKFMDSIS